MGTPTHFYDQTIINIAAQRLNVALTLLDERYNYIDWGRRGAPGWVFVAHAAGGTTAKAPFERALADRQQFPNTEVGRRAGAIIRRIGPHAKGVEVGVFKGDLSSMLFDKFPGLTLTLVDRWAPPPPNSTCARSGDGAAQTMRRDADACLERTLYVTAFAEGRRRVLRMDSTAAAGGIEAASQDFVFIDADHTYEGVASDLKAWSKCVRPGGWLCGHDYGIPESSCMGR